MVEVLSWADFSSFQQYGQYLVGSANAEVVNTFSAVVTFGPLMPCKSMYTFRRNQYKNPFLEKGCFFGIKCFHKNCENYTQKTPFLLIIFVTC